MNHQMNGGRHAMPNGQTMDDRATNPSGDAAASPHAGMAMDEGTRVLAVRPENGRSPSDLAFSVRENGQPFTDYGVSHTKEMHLVVVRDDLRHFSHLHPSRDEAGVWHVELDPNAGGTYWLYADFADASGGSYTLRFDKSFPGAGGAHGVDKDFSTAKAADGYLVTVKPSLSGNVATFAFDIADANGGPVELEDYLGAKGHGLLLTEDGGFVHAHAEDSPPVFTADVRPGTFYRLFVQFQIRGEVVTVPFDWKA